MLAYWDGGETFLKKHYILTSKFCTLLINFLMQYINYPGKVWGLIFLG